LTHINPITGPWALRWSASQIALFAAPALVLASYVIGPMPMN
jgi:hypothetical protein